MLIEVKAKVAYLIDSKIKKKSVTFVLDQEFFSEAEYTVTQDLTEQQTEGSVSNFDLLSLRSSGIKEIITQYEGEHSYIATLKDVFLADDGTEKPLKYKILLWANSISEAMANTREYATQGYNMSIEGLKEVDYIYLNTQEDGDTSATQD